MAPNVVDDHMYGDKLLLADTRVLWSTLSDKDIHCHVHDPWTRAAQGNQYCFNAHYEKITGNLITAQLMLRCKQRALHFMVMFPCIDGQFTRARHVTSPE